MVNLEKGEFEKMIEKVGRNEKKKNATAPLVRPIVTMDEQKEDENEDD